MLSPHPWPEAAAGCVQSPGFSLAEEKLICRSEPFMCSQGESSAAEWGNTAVSCGSVGSLHFSKLMFYEPVVLGLVPVCVESEKTPIDI